MAAGVEKTIQVRRGEACEACEGSGAKKGTSTTECDYCHGRGEIQQTQGFFAIRTTCPHCNGEGRSIANPCPECSGS